MRRTSSTRRSAGMTILATLPAASLALVCGTALVLVMLASAALDQSAAVTRRAGTLGAAASSLADAIQDAELAQRSFLADTSLVRQDEFRDALQRVDHLLISPTMLDLAASLDRDIGGNVESLIVARMQVLATQAAVVATEDEASPRVQPAAMVSQTLRAWAATATDRAMTASDAAARTAILRDEAVMFALLAGFAIGCWSTWKSLRSLTFRPAAPVPTTASLRPAPTTSFSHELPLGLAGAD